jgi:excisionase family DNA binding protein
MFRGERGPDIALQQQFAWTCPHWAELLDIPLGTVREMVAAKQIASVKSGRRRLITTSPQDYLASLAGPAAAE